MSWQQQGGPFGHNMPMTPGGSTDPNRMAFASNRTPTSPQWSAPSWPPAPETPDAPVYCSTGALFPMQGGSHTPSAGQRSASPNGRFTSSGPKFPIPPPPASGAASPRAQNTFGIPPPPPAGQGRSSPSSGGYSPNTFQIPPPPPPGGRPGSASPSVSGGGRSPGAFYIPPPPTQSLGGMVSSPTSATGGYEDQSYSYPPPPPPIAALRRRHHHHFLQFKVEEAVRVDRRRPLHRHHLHHHRVVGPTWRQKQEAEKAAQRQSGCGYDPAQIAAQGPQDGTQPFCYLPPQLVGTLNSKDKKPFTYTPGGLDLSEIKSPRIQRRINARQEAAAAQGEGWGDPPSRQMEGLNLDGTQQQDRYVDPNRTHSLPRPPAPGQRASDPGDFVQSRSFRVLQKITDTDSPDYQPPPPKPREEDEMRFSGLRRDQIPSRSFQALQKMTGADDQPYQQQQQQQQYYYPQSQQEPPPDIREYCNHPEELDDTTINPRYRGGNIPSRSFKMLQEMTGDDGSVAPSEAEPDPRKYTGGSIPSRSFKMLQAMTGENTGDGGTDF
ncbi:hypothetical protein MTO96_023411 [Rhipicephalus appendiculatus]